MMGAMRTPTAALWLTVAAASAAAASAQEPAPPSAAEKALARAGAARVELLHHWRWGEAGAPALVSTPIGPTVYHLCFARDDTTLAFQSQGDAWVLRVDDGSTAALRLPQPGMEASLAGPGPRGTFAAVHLGRVYLCRIDRDPEALDTDLPQRADGFASPFGPRLLITGLGRAGVRTSLLDWQTQQGAEVAAPGLGVHAARVAWSSDDKLVAVAWGTFTAASRTAQGVTVLTTAGKPLHDLAAGADLVTAMDFTFDNRALTWVDEEVHRLDLATGKPVATAEGQALCWAHVDPVLALGVDTAGISFWDGERLARARTEPIDEPPLTVGKRTVGPVLGAAISGKRRLLAVATVTGLRLYRVLP